MDTIQILTDLLQNNQYVAVVTAVVTLASAVSAAVPAPKEGTILAKAFKIINFLAVNIGNAKNKK